MKQQYLGFNYDDNDQVKTWEFGDFIKKTCLLMKDSDMKWKLACKADEIQHNEYPTPQEHARRINGVAKDLTDYLTGRPEDDHFIL